MLLYILQIYGLYFWFIFSKISAIIIQNFKAVAMGDDRVDHRSSDSCHVGIIHSMEFGTTNLGNPHRYGI